jgi:hypothetical protein
MKNARAMSHRSSKTEVEVSKRIILKVGKIVSSFCLVLVVGGRATFGVVEEILKVLFAFVGLFDLLVRIDLLWFKG